MDYTTVGVIATVAAIAIAIVVGHFMPGNSKRAVPWIGGILAASFLLYILLPNASGSTNTMPATTPETKPPTVPSTTTPTAISMTPWTTTSTTVSTTERPTTTSSGPAIPTAVDKIDVYLEALQGRKVGPTSFAFDGNLDFGLGYGWHGTAGGVEVDGESCQIRMQVTGPESFPAQRTAKCSERVHSGFNGGINSERITQPGEYTVTVADELTGTVGIATFTLIGR
ncbi:hypothetical protein [Mycolicibacterium sp. J2]|uniref:hypothetical protein n=1 Tax=Mycolicibacterium sp. J2 TaxID=2993511 RepID=UPI00224A7F58|nr:hypothetical protein [Mycolicibacterium sp. J2]MCX2714407.1 hypothetical protein [Mycolicibacterium sp. J2]